MYSIKDLERISSTKAHTIRIWEQRYGLLHPVRTDSNIRCYDDEQLKKLLNVCTLLAGGMKISAISKLTKAEMSVEIEKIIAGSVQTDVRIEALINRALGAIATFNPVMFEELFNEAVADLGLPTAYQKVIYPLLVRTGLLWLSDDLLPSQEHFLSNLVRQKLFSAINALPLPGNATQKWVLFLNEDEDHEIGLLFASYLIRLNAQEVIYLGARVPYRDLAKVVTASEPTHIYSFMVSNQSSEQINRFLDRLSEQFSHIQICISGASEEIRTASAKKSVTFIDTIDMLTQILTPHAA